MRRKCLCGAELSSCEDFSVVQVWVHVTQGRIGQATLTKPLTLETIATVMGLWRGHAPKLLSLSKLTLYFTPISVSVSLY